MHQRWITFGLKPPEAPAPPIVGTGGGFDLLSILQLWPPFGASVGGEVVVGETVYLYLLYQYENHAGYTLYATITRLADGLVFDSFSGLFVPPADVEEPLLPLVSGLPWNYELASRLGNIAAEVYGLQTITANEPFESGRYRVDITAETRIRSLYFDTPLRGNQDPTLVPADMGLIFTDLRQVLVDSGLYTESQVNISLEEQPDPFLSPNQVFLRPSESRGDDGMRLGGGRSVPLVRGGFDVILADLSARDVTSRDGRRITRFGSSVIAQRDSIIEVFSQYIPIDAMGNHLAAEPIAPRSGNSPKRYGGKTAEWSALVTGFDLTYLRRPTSAIWN